MQWSGLTDHLPALRGRVSFQQHINDQSDERDGRCKAVGDRDLTLRNTLHNTVAFWLVCVNSVRSEVYKDELHYSQHNENATNNERQ